jgi:CheY-like chemotaxis protein
VESQEAERVGTVGAGVPDLAGTLHEVSNALTVVLGWLEHAGQSIPGGPTRDALEVALTHARLGFSIARRAIGAEVEEALVPRGALRLTEQAALGVAREAERRQVRIVVDASQDALLCAAPAAHQILLNLLLNAIAFSPAGGAVRVGVRSQQDAVVFFVEDEGPGIAADRAETLFGNPVSTRVGGAGLGLTYAHGLARAHQGELRLSSTGPNGSCFELWWPTGDAPSGTVHRLVRATSLDGARVVVLEDDAAVRSLIDLGLSARGARVVAVDSLTELERVTERGIFDVALVDLSPFGAAPTPALRRLRATGGRRLPIVVISGSVAPEVEPDVVDAWVRKPFEIGELADAIGALLDPL